MTTKLCTKCKIEKDVGDFYLIKEKPGGCCKVCKSVANKSYRENNREYVKELNDKWRRENPERCQEYRTKWRKENPELHKASITKWRRENQDLCRELHSKWRRENPERARALYVATNHRRAENLTNSYVKSTLGIANPPQELIELKRVQLQIHRELKQQGEK